MLHKEVIYEETSKMFDILVFRIFWVEPQVSLLSVYLKQSCKECCDIRYNMLHSVFHVVFFNKLTIFPDPVQEDGKHYKLCMFMFIVFSTVYVYGTDITCPE